MLRTNELRQQMDAAGKRGDWDLHYRLQDKLIAVSREESRADAARREAAALKPPTKVLMSWKLRTELQELAAASGSTGLEAGGFLFGTIEPDLFRTGTRVEILEISRPSRDDKRSPTHLVMAHLEDAAAGRLSKWPLIGDWHTHVSGESPSRAASDTDLAAWGGRADRVSWKPGRAPGYIGIVVAGNPGPEGNRFRMEPRAWFVPPLRWDVKPEQQIATPIAIQEA